MASLYISRAIGYNNIKKEAAYGENKNHGERRREEKALAACAEIGISLSDAVNAYLSYVARERRIPFELKGEPDPFYSEKNLGRLRRSIAEMEKTGGPAHDVPADF